MEKVGIKDIAQRAGVSIATVSHAFRNPGRVSDKTRARVLAAASELGYTPNQQAVNLRTARSGNIVVIIPDIADSYNSEIIKGIEAVARKRGYSVLLGDTQGTEEREREFANMVHSRQADGIILMSNNVPFDIQPETPIEDIPPIVNGSEFAGHPGILSVSIDDKQGGKDATNHLLELGHRDIGVITGDRHSTSTQRRLEGFHEAMQEAGVEVDENLIIYGMYEVDMGEAAATELLVRKKRPTAIFCFSDELALGCMHSLHAAGFSVPDDISVIGFDDIAFARYFSPPLTTIAQPAEAIGRTCTELLIDLIEGKRPKRNRFILPHALVVRSSTRQLD
ncbi:MAG: LacI family DNA-binding transcriptional regulator [Woeseiaceae bacterium]|jgi:LacI family transcriptional regulator, repressor for deo operon, udp, cdd, tsx, nupC, and nupG